MKRRRPLAARRLPGAEIRDALAAFGSQMVVEHYNIMGVAKAARRHSGTNQMRHSLPLLRHAPFR